MKSLLTTWTRLTASAAVILLFAAAGLSQTAKLQVIHNSPDPAAAVVDVYVGEDLLLDDFAFRTATEFLEVPADVVLTIGVAPAGSASSAEAIATQDVGPLGADTAYVAVATGVLDPPSFAANPEELDTGFRLLTFLGQEAGTLGFVDVAIVHGVPDAGAVDGFSVTSGTNIAEGLSYGSVAPYSPFPPGAYELELRPAGSEDALASYGLDISTLAGQAAVVLASGFADPAANADGPALEALVVLTDGTTFLLQPPPLPITSIKDLNTLVEGAVDELMAGGAEIDGTRIRELLRSNGFLDESLLSVDGGVTGDEVRFVAVVMTDPFESGLANVDSEGRVNRLHVFVRDTAAATQGPDGMGMQIVDGNYEGRTDVLTVGDVIDVQGNISWFFNTVQFFPNSVRVLGQVADFDLGEDFLDPVVAATADINQSVGENQFQGNWSNIETLNNQYVKIENATVFSRTVGARPDWSISTDGGDTRLWIYDTGILYRNDRTGYPDFFASREDDFVPPPVGSVINLSGYITATGDDPDGVSQPGFSVLNISPMAEDDLEILQTPPQITNLSSPAAIPGAEPLTVTADVVADPTRSLTSVQLGYTVWTDGTPDSEDPSYVDMAVNAEGAYEGQIPAPADGSFVAYMVKAVDNAGAESESAAKVTRFLSDGIDSIEDVQLTADRGEGAGPFVGITTDVDITGVVNNDPSAMGWMVVQDDEDLGPWSGVLVEVPDGMTVAMGDQVNITSATIQEIRGIRFDRDGDLTGLGDATVETVAAKTMALPGYKVLGTDSLNKAMEAYEGMMLRFENVWIADDDTGFGEWLMSTTGDEADGVEGDDAANELFDAGGGPGIFDTYEIYDFIQGVWSHSFGEFKLMPEALTDIGVVTNVANEPIDGSVPDRYALEQNYPNPFNPSTTIDYSIRNAGHVTVDVYDMMGRRVRALVDADLAPGTYQATFNAESLASGVYIYRLKAGNEVLTRKMLLQK